MLAGCGAGLPRLEPAPDADVVVPASPAALPFEAPASGGLSAGLVFNTLVAEVAVQRGDMQTAYAYYLQGARMSADPYSAEQAVRIGIYLKDIQKALVAVEQWVQLAPEHLPGRALGVMLYMQADQLDRAFEQLQLLVTISEEQGEDGFMRAVAAVSQVGDRHAGLELIRRLVAAHGDDPRARYALALAAVGAEEYAEAEAEVRKLVDTYPERPKAQALLASILRSRGNLRGALQVLETALEEAPADRILLMAYARLLVEAEELEAAYQQFRRLEASVGGDTDITYTLGILALELKRWDEGRAYLLQLFDSGRRGDEAAFYIAHSYEQEGDLDRALDWYGRVMGGNQRIEAQVRASILLGRRGELDEARALLRELRTTARHRSVELFLVEGEILREGERYEEVMALFNQALREIPGNSELLYARAMNAAAMGRFDVLEQDLQAILQQNPKHADALNALGYTLADKTERFQEALGYIEQALALKPDSPAILDSMGWVQYRLGRHEVSLRYLRRAMELMPDAEIAAHLGEVLWVTGDQEQARKIWREALERDPHSKPLQEAIKRFQP
jgi:tetratricopeptide (TPR) repeat protein